MRIPNLRLAVLAVSGGLALGGCAYGFDPYGSGVSVGYGYGNPYGAYGYGYGGYPYGGYGYGGYPYGGYGNYIGYGYGGYPYGWYNGYYYPGTGYYVYDRDRRRRQITDAERQYWRDKFDRYRSSSQSGSRVTTSAVTPRENWSGFKRVRPARSSDSNASTNRGPDRSRWTRSTETRSSRSDKADSRSSDFMRRHAPKNKD